jgi:hypothetical protein
MANMTTNTESREPRNGGQQNSGQQGSAQQSSGQQGEKGPQSTVGRAASTAAGLATKQVEKTRERFEEQIADQRSRISGRVRTLGRALHGAGEMLEEDDLAAQALHYASEKIEGVAGYVEELSPTRVAEDLRSVAHTRPIWFFGGAFALGLALGRFARSTGGSMQSSGGLETTRAYTAPRGRGESATRGYGEQPERSATPADRAGIQRP